MKVTEVAAIVTGGASGLGAAAAKYLAAAGAKVTLFDIKVETGEIFAQEIGARFLHVDVTNEEAVSEALAVAEGWHGKARILINCAGIGPPMKVVDRNGSAMPLGHFARIININLVGTFNVLSRFVARIAELNVVGEERGIIINAASIAAYDGQIGQAAYAASKGGVVSMTLPLAREFARYGIRVMTIAPGVFETPMVASLPSEAQESLGKQVPFPSRLGQPDEFAQLVKAIIENPMLNGEVIRIDGALRMGPK